jgi:hypothetical protein
MPATHSHIVADRYTLVRSLFTTFKVDNSTVFIKSFIITPTLSLNNHLINYHIKDAPKHRCTASRIAQTTSILYINTSLTHILHLFNILNIYFLENMSFNTYLTDEEPSLSTYFTLIKRLFNPYLTIKRVLNAYSHIRLCEYALNTG